MKSLQILVPLVFLGFSSAFCADGKSITKGTPIAIAEGALKKHGYNYGDQFTLQIAHRKGISYPFCKLDPRATLVIAYDTSTRLVSRLSVCYAPPEMRTKGDSVFVYPIAAEISSGEYTLVFQKNNKQLRLSH